VGQNVHAKYSSEKSHHNPILLEMLMFGKYESIMNLCEESLKVAHCKKEKRKNWALGYTHN